MTHIHRRYSAPLALGAAVLLAVSGCSGQVGGANAARSDGLLTIATYPVGSGTYNELAAVSDAMTSETDRSIRLIPADTGPGRVTMVMEGLTDLGRLGEEYWDAFEGANDFATESWGPTELNVVWHIPASLGIAVPEDSDIRVPADLEGVRVPYVVANPSVNNKMDAALALGGLTRDDVEEVTIGGYSEVPEALRAGRVDVIPFNSTASAMRELDAQFGFRWLDLEAADAQATEATGEIAPTVTIEEVMNAAGMTEGASADALTYGIPIVARPDQDADFVHQYIVELVGTFDTYADSLTGMGSHKIENVAHEPSVVPFHPGLVRFLEENDLWTAEAEQKNEELNSRADSLRAEWKKYIDQTPQDDVNDVTWTRWKEARVDD